MIDDIVQSVRKYHFWHCGKQDLPQGYHYGCSKEGLWREEKSPVSREGNSQILENADIAKDEKRPLCQDTGLAVFFVKVGDEVKIKGGLLKDA